MSKCCAVKIVLFTIFFTGSLENTLSGGTVKHNNKACSIMFAYKSHHVIRSKRCGSKHMYGNGEHGKQVAGLSNSVK